MQCSSVELGDAEKFMMRMGMKLTYSWDVDKGLLEFRGDLYADMDCSH